MTEYAEILRAIADGRRIQAGSAHPSDPATPTAWRHITHHAALRLITGKRSGPLHLRIAPDVLSINGYEVQQGMATAPEMGSTYWYVDTTSPDGVAETVWDGSGFDQLLLARGLVHASLELAQPHARALLSFTQR